MELERLLPEPMKCSLFLQIDVYSFFHCDNNKLEIPPAVAKSVLTQSIASAKQ